MKAIVCEKFGSPDVLQLKEIDKPEFKDNEVLIRNYASSVDTVDIMYRNAKLPQAIFWTFKAVFGPLSRFEVGLRKPKRKIPGGDFAGEIVSVGKDVTEWNEGDKVYGYSDTGGTYAEYFSLPANYRKLTKMPANMSFQEAGAVPGGAPPALTGLRDLGDLQKGQKILIIGASGGIGTYAVQMAKNIYEAEVTAVCGSKNMDLVKKIGADFVIDYTKEDYTKINKKFDVIFDAVAVSTFSKCKRILTKNGLYVANNPLNSKKHLYHMMFSKKKFKQRSTDESAENLTTIREWIEEGKVKSVIDTVYPLSNAAEAHHLYETGHAKGRIVISID